MPLPFADRVPGPPPPARPAAGADDGGDVVHVDGGNDGSHAGDAGDGGDVVGAGVRLAREHRAALAALGVGLVVVDAALQVVICDEAAQRALGARIAQMHTDPPGLQVLRPDGTQWPLDDRPVQAAVREGRVTSSSVLGLRGPRRTRWLRVSARPLRPGGGPPHAALCTVTDVTVEHERELALRESETRFRLLAEHATDVITVSGPDGRCAYCSPAVRDLLGVDPESAVGTDLLAVVHPDDRPLVRRVLRRLMEGAPRQSVRHRVLHADGRVLWVETAARAVPARDGGLEVQSSTRDVTARVEAERRLARLALADPLTGLANRAALLQRVEDLVAGGTGVALLFLDLDRFKVVNDSLGHAAGDELLRTVAGRLGGLGPDVLAARTGGDEFVVAAPDLDEEGALRLAERVRGLLAEPFVLGGCSLVVTASTGVVVSGTGGERGPEVLLRDADVAMYRAKARGGARTTVWDAHVDAAAGQRLATEHDLRAALAGGQLVVHYQPQVDLTTGRITGVEALARWQHPERGLLLPAAFLQVADETGLVLELGRQVLAEAARQVASWRRTAGGAGLSLSVNVSALELQQADRVAATAAVLEAAGLPPGALTVEVLESVLLDAEGTVEASLAAYSRLGVRLALDDFGTGSSSLLHLRQVEVDTVKVDRTFVAGLGRSARDEAIVRALSALAADLGMGCVAEGVEQERQREWLRAQGVGLAQGFLLHRPLPAEQVSLLLADPCPGAR